MPVAPRAERDRLDGAPVIASIRLTVSIAAVGDPHRPVADGDPGRSVPDRDRLHDPPGDGVDARHRAAEVVRHPHRTAAERDPARVRADRDALNDRPTYAGSILDTVLSLVVAQTAPTTGGQRRRRGPDRRVGDDRPDRRADTRRPNRRRSPTPTPPPPVEVTPRTAATIATNATAPNANPRLRRLRVAGAGRGAALRLRESTAGRLPGRAWGLD